MVKKKKRPRGRFLKLRNSRVQDDHGYDHQDADDAPDPLDLLLVLARENIHMGALYHATRSFKSRGKSQKFFQSLL